MRYCPNCKKMVNTSLTGGQIVVMIILYLVFFPAGILYSVFHARKCPICLTPTEDKVKYEIKTKEKNNGKD